MSESNKIVARDWFQQVWNERSEKAIDRMFKPGGKAYGFVGSDGVLEGPEEFRAAHRSFLSAFPDLHVELEDMIAEGDRVAVRWKFTGTHTGEGAGLPAFGEEGRVARLIVPRDRRWSDPQRLEPDGSASAVYEPASAVAFRSAICGINRNEQPQSLVSRDKAPHAEHVGGFTREGVDAFQASEMLLF